MQVTPADRRRFAAAWQQQHAAAEDEPQPDTIPLDQLPYAMVQPETARAAIRIESAAALRLAHQCGVRTP